MTLSRAALVLAVAVVGCESAPEHAAAESGADSQVPGCLNAAHAYEGILARARVCDPARADECGPDRPTAVYEQFPSGEEVLQGICSFGMTAVTTAGVAEVDRALNEYDSLGCPRVACPSGPPRSSPARCVAVGPAQGECR